MLTRVLTSVCAIHSCVVVATQCMHDAVSLAACCVFVRPPPSWAHQWLLCRGSPIDPTIAPVVSVRSIDSFAAICTSDHGHTRSPEARHQSSVSCFKPECESPEETRSIECTAKSWLDPSEARYSCCFDSKGQTFERWMVSAGLRSVSDSNISDPGVCLVSSPEARKAVAELKGAHPLAILSPANIENRGQ